MNEMFNKLKAHVGHNIEIVTYGLTSKEDDQVNVSIECLDCNEVLIDFDKNDEREENLPYVPNYDKFKDNDDYPGEIGWNNGEFYKEQMKNKSGVYYQMKGSNIEYYRTLSNKELIKFIRKIIYKLYKI